MKHTRILGFPAIIASFIASPAIAQDVSTTQDAVQGSTAQENKVKITLQPYVWVPTLKGSAKLGQIGAPVHVKPKDFVDGFQIGGMGRVKIEQNNRFIYLDAIIVDYDSSSFRPFFEQPLLAKIRYYDFGVGFTKSLRLDDNSALTISPQIGVQHLSLLADVNGSLLVAKASDKWWSPSVGLTAKLPLTKRLSVVLAANAAGFGLGRTNYQNGAAALEYRLGRHWNISAGYRIAKGRYDSIDGLAIDLNGGGPVLAIAYSFNLSN